MGKFASAIKDGELPGFQVVRHRTVAEVVDFVEELLRKRGGYLRLPGDGEPIVTWLGDIGVKKSAVNPGRREQTDFLV